MIVIGSLGFWARRFACAVPAADPVGCAIFGRRHQVGAREQIGWQADLNQ